VAGTKAYVTGMGSNNVVVIDAAGARAGLAPTIPVGEGPTGIALDAAHGRIFVLDKFEAAISIVDLATEIETARVPFHDASPAAIRAGRKHLYDTHKTSGLGQVACASCHVDARFDRLAWDLGDPAGAPKPTTGQNLGANLPGLNTGFVPWHPMKGPMTTQTLQDIIGKEPLHWRGDRAGLEEFNPAFVALQGDDAQLTPAEMQEYEDFLATIAYPPNPYRNFDNTLPTDLPLPGHHTTGGSACPARSSRTATP
jgi:YVTN family beta-propeller protein